MITRRVLLATWYENYNYGTVLQAYALKKVMEQPSSTGLCNEEERQNVIECDFLPHVPVRVSNKKGKWKKLFSIAFYKMKVQQYRDKREYARKAELFKKRENVFKEFINENFCFAKDSNLQSVEELEDIADKYDFVIAGSDQIWNPEALDATYLLGWAKSQKKFSYGSSLSVQCIPAKYEGIYRRALEDFKCISIRDVACCQQLSDILGRKVVTVVDPVILLGAKGLLENAERIDDEPYVFCYFLGNNKQHRMFARNVAKSRNLKIRAVINAGSDFRADAVLEDFADWNVNPWKFVSYIHDAELVITDSFHATVISVLMHKNFTVLEKDGNRPEQNNRILEFLRLSGLENRWGKEFIDIVVTNEQWENADRVLECKRKESFAYLMEALL